MPDLSDGVNWSEVDANNNNAAPNGWPEGMMPSGVNDAARADRGALKRFWNKANPVQVITRSGGVWTFTTSNPAYPTAYVDGEIYWFHPAGPSVGGDFFEVNALGPKPIWKRVMPITGGWAPIIANDIDGNTPVQVLYVLSLNAGTGAFLLLNPFVPIQGDGAGGVVMPGGSLEVTGGGITVNGDLRIQVPGHTDKTIGYLTRHNQAAGSRRLGVTASAPGGVYSALEEFAIIATATVATGSVAAAGFTSRSGTPGPWQTNLFNIQWKPGDGAHLWIDSTDLGPIVTSPPGANLVTPGDLTVGGALHVTTAATVGGALSVTGAISGAGLSTTGDTTAAGIFRTTSTGASSGGVSIYATAGAIRSDVAGTALYLPNGNVVCESITAANNVSVAGSVTAAQLQVTGNAAIDGSLGLAGNLNGNIATLTQLQLNGNAAITGSVGIAGDLTVGGTINGHPATALFDQLAALTARVQALEAALTARME